MPDPRRNPFGPGVGNDPFDRRPIDEDPLGGKPILTRQLEFEVTSWPRGRLIGRDSVRIRVSGTARLLVVSRNDVSSTPVGKVEVRLGNGDFQRANRTGLDGLGWSFTGDATRGDIGSPSGGQLRITARAVSGTLRQVRHHTVTVVFDRDPPDLTITRPEPGDVVETRGPPYEVVVEGRASDLEMGVVECGLDDGSMTRARNLGRDWGRWRAEVALPEVGEHEIVVRARDGAGNTTTERVTVEVRLEPPMLTVEDPVEGAFDKEWSETEGLTVEVAGEASDEVNDVATVGWALDDGVVHEAEDLSAPSEEEWSRWRTAIRIPTANTNEVVLRAEDVIGLVTEETLSSNTIWQLFFQAIADDGR